MKRNKKTLILTTIFLSFIIYKYVGIIQKDNWVNEPSYIKYSEKRENEVWGEILRGNNPPAPARILSRGICLKTQFLYI